MDRTARPRDCCRDFGRCDSKDELRRRDDRPEERAPARCQYRETDRDHAKSRPAGHHIAR